MLFKDLKAGYPVYILHKGESIKAVQGKTVSVSAPHLPVIAPNQIQGQTMQLVVDVTVESEGGTNTYTIPDSLTVTYANDLVLATEREGIVRELEAMKSQSEEIVKSVERHEAIIASCEKILEEWNPVFAEKKRQDERILGLESEVKGLGKMLSDFINEFRK